MLFLKVDQSVAYNISIVVYEKDFEILRAFENEILNFESVYFSQVKNFLNQKPHEVDLIKQTDKETAQGSN